ncbi:MAG: hypothetical protein ABI045_05400 [Flavobacteriales bacterium]
MKQKNIFFVPAHAFTLSSILSELVPNTSLELPKALDYPRRKQLYPNKNIG